MRSKSRIADQKVDKAIDKYVSEERKMFSLSIRDGKVVYSGNKKFLDHLLSAGVKNVTLETISEMMLQDDGANAFSSETLPVFPCLKYKFKGNDWTYNKAYDYLKVIMNILGFYYGSKKCYGEPDDKPIAWPDCLSWTDFKHPSQTSLNKMNIIIEHVLSFYGFDVYTHMIQDQSASDPVSEATEVDPVPAAVTEEESAQAHPTPAEDQPGGSRPLDRTENLDEIFPFLPSEIDIPRNNKNNNNNKNVNLQEEDDEDSEDEKEDGELESDLSEPDYASDDNGNDETGNDDEVDEEESGNAYLQLRKRNIEEQQQLWKEVMQEKEAVASELSKPKKKKQKKCPQPQKVTSQYTLRKAPRTNPKYAD